MALLEEQFTESESLDAGATPIKYEGDVERQREIAEQLWAQLNPQQQMEFGTFEQFFSSGAWKKVLEMLMQQQRGEGQNIMEGEGSAVMEQGMGMQAPALPPTPSPMVNPGAGAAAPGPAGGMGQRPIMPQPRPAMARGGIAELFEEEEIEEPGFDEIEEEEVIEDPDFRKALRSSAMKSLKGPGQIKRGVGGAPVMRPRLASHDPEDVTDEAWFNLWKEHPMGQMFPSVIEFQSWYLDQTDYDPDRMAEGGRIGFGLGSFVKKAFKKAKRAVKKIAKSPIGKAALMYAATAGIGSLAAGGGWGSLLKGSTYLPGTVMGNLGTAWKGSPLPFKTANDAVARTGGIKNFLGGLKGSTLALGAGMAAPYLFPNLGKPKDQDTPEIGGRADSPDIDLDEITRTVQGAYKKGPDAVAALQQRFPYLLPYESAKLAEGGRIGYAEGSYDKDFDKWGYKDFKSYQSEGGELPWIEWYGKIHIPELDKKFGIDFAQGGRIGYGLGSWLKRKLGRGQKEAFAMQKASSNGAPVAPVAQDPDVMRSKLYNYFANKMGGRDFKHDFREQWTQPFIQAAEGGRIGAQEGGLMDLGGMEKDYRQEGGFVPLGGEEKADDVPARLSKNEFVFTADAVRAAGGGDIDQGAEVMENVMDNLEQGGQISEESQGLEGARDMFATSERLSEVV